MDILLRQARRSHDAGGIGKTTSSAPKIGFSVALFILILEFVLDFATLLFSSGQAGAH